MNIVTRLTKNKRIAISIVVVCILFFIALIFTINFLNDSAEPTDQTATETNNGEKASISNSKGSQNSSTDTEVGVSSNEAPATPYGAFVSNHSVSMSSETAENMGSMCKTTPGATCTIIFTKNGISKELPSKRVDEQGTAQWIWNLQELGLTAGSWTVEAVATLNNKEARITDPIKFEVST